MPLDDYPAPVAETDLSLGGLVLAIKSLPSHSSKWEGVTLEQLSEWFIPESDRIVVLCKTINDRDNVSRCIITPSNKEERSFGGMRRYYIHNNAAIQFFYKGGGTNSKDLRNVGHAIESLSEFLFPLWRVEKPERPLFNAYTSHDHVFNPDESCETTEKIWQCLTFYKIPFHLESKNIHSNLILDRFDRSRFDTAEINPRHTLRNESEIPAAIYVSKRLYQLTTTDSLPFITVSGLIDALKSVGAVD